MFGTVQPTIFNMSAAAGALCFLHTIDNADGTVRYVYSIHTLSYYWRRRNRNQRTVPIEASTFTFTLQKEFDIWRANNPCSSETFGASLGMNE